MPIPDEERRSELAQRLLGGEALKWLRDSLRRKLLGATDDAHALSGFVAKRNTASREEREALERLLGRSGAFKNRLTVRAEDISALLSTAGFPNIREVLEIIDGPLISERKVREEEDRRWRDLIRNALTPMIDLAEEPDDFTDRLSVGPLKRLSRHDPEEARALLRDVHRLWRRLAEGEGGSDVTPRPQGTPAGLRAELAASLFGDSHALDRGATLVTLMKRLMGRTGMSDAAFWDAWGIAASPTNSTVLFLNLRFVEGSAAPAFNALAATGEPCRATLRMFRDDPRPHSPTEVFVCENPAVLEAAADRLGPRSRPLVCVEGQPSLACRKLLTTLVGSGTRLRYHGDFDWGGIRIANGLFRELPELSPWRYDSAHYEKWVSDARDGGLAGGRAVDALWDDRLRPSMERRGKYIHEESVLPELLTDLVLEESSY